MSHHHGHHHEEHVQCDHSQGIRSHGECEHGHGGDAHCNMEDPLFQKQDWTVEDWIEMYNKFPDVKKEGQPTKMLIKYLKEILPSEPAKVLLPLCGKSPDLKWLYDRGNTVVGIECSEKVVQSFFETYPDLKHSVEDVPFGKLFKSSDERLQVYVCNVTHIPEGKLGMFDAVFDWAAYTAINTQERQKYVDIMKSCMGDSSRYFLEVCHDADEDAKGVPNSVSFRTIKQEFNWNKKMKILETLDIAEEWNLKSFFNSYIMFIPKQSF